ncbi:MAG: pyrroloquinoline quinone-dependent dehydrogenase [Sphingomonas sp.]
MPQRTRVFAWEWIAPLLIGGAAVAVLLAIYGYVWAWGISGSLGALIVLGSTAILLLAVLLVSFAKLPRWLAILLHVGIALDLIGTGAAAYFLESYWLLGFMVVTAIGWLGFLFGGGREASRSRRTPVAIVLAIPAVAVVLIIVALAWPQQWASPPSSSAPATAQADTTWSTFNGDLKAQKYSPAGMITPANVARLRPAWEVHTGDVSSGGKVPHSYFEATPLFVNNTVYIGTPFYRIFAIAPDTGKVKWIFDPHAKLKALTQPGMKSRGVAYWQAANPVPGQPCQKIVYVGTMDAKLFAVDADTGKPCRGFGQNGMLDVNKWNSQAGKYPFSLLQPPTVYKDTLFLGWAGKDWALQQAPAGLFFALDARTGKLKWTFDPLPRGEERQTGTADVWASVSVDPQHGIVYLPVSSPSPNFYGGARKAPIPYGTSITALDADTGKVIWSRQLVHHDLWDYDNDSAPVLVDIQKGGKVIPALVQATKQGYLFVLNRLTGEPIYPIAEVPVPQSDVPGEQSAPTQPKVFHPQPVIPEHFPGVSTIADITSLGWCSRKAGELRHEGRFTPASLQGTLIFPPTAGGVEWGGGAVDPRSQTYVVNNSYVAMIYKMIPRQKYDEITKNGASDAYHAMMGSPYGFYNKNFTNWLGMPCWKPPYGSISAYDLKTGDLLWKEPFGQVQKYGFFMPKSWGSVTIGGPLITRTGLVFIGASMDSRVRALDMRTGKVLWTGNVDAPAVATPATYVYKGKQYVVFSAGGTRLLLPKVSDQVIAYALP